MSRKKGMKRTNYIFTEKNKTEALCKNTQYAALLSEFAFGHLLE